MNMNYLLIAGVLISNLAIADEAEVTSPVTENGIVKVEWQDPASYRDIKSSNELQSRFENRFFETMTKNITGMKGHPRSWTQLSGLIFSKIYLSQEFAQFDTLAVQQ